MLKLRPGRLISPSTLLEKLMTPSPRLTTLVSPPVRVVLKKGSIKMSFLIQYFRLSNIRVVNTSLSFFEKSIRLCVDAEMETLRALGTVGGQGAWSLEPGGDVLCLEDDSR